MEYHSDNIKSSVPNNETRAQEMTSARPNLLSNLRSLTRLVIGGFVIGSDRLTSGIQDWESSIENENSSNYLTQYESENYEGFSSDPEELYSDQETIRFALVGLIFKTQDKFEAGLNTIDILSRNVSNLTNPLILPLTKNRFTRPFQHLFNQLVTRGEEQVSQWVEIGKTEELRSRRIVENAAIDQVDNAVIYLAETPEVQDIIQGQSMSLANEIVEEIRERAVSADNLFEDSIRTLFRLKSRSELPAPPAEVLEKAFQIRTRGNTIKS